MNPRGSRTVVTELVSSEDVHDYVSYSSRAMAPNAGPLLLIGLCLLTCTTFYLQYVIFLSVHQVSKRSLHDDWLLQGRSGDINTVVEFDHQVDVDTVADTAVVPSNGNFYISVKGYVIRKQPVQHVEQIRQQYEPTVYKIVAELAHRYGVKYIIDIGCGTAKHLTKLSHEFNIIGIDYGVNLERARTAFPHLTFIEADLDKDKGCNVALPEDTLLQSIVVSAEVIEHLVDPLYCLVRLLRHMSAYAAAVVVTSPDRQRLAKAFHWPRSLKGPPMNKHHVREWTLEEMAAMFSDVGMHVVLSSWVCGRAKGCPAGFTLAKNPYVNQLLVLGNGNVRRVWEDTSLAVNIKVTAFVVIHPHTHPDLLKHSLRHLSLHDVQLYIIQRGCNVTLPVNTEVLNTVFVQQTDQVQSVIKTAIASKEFNYGDWFIAQDAHEVLSVPLVLGPTSNLTLRQYLQRVAYSPYCFNAIPLTVITMDGFSGNRSRPSKERLPFKIHTHAMWDDAEGRTVYPRRDTLRDRVRVWRKTYTGAKIFTTKTRHTSHVITDVHFLGRRVYPFHLLSMRFNPHNGKPGGTISRNLSLMYGLDIAFGYSTATRRSVYQNHLPF